MTEQTNQSESSNVAPNQGTPVKEVRDGELPQPEVTPFEEPLPQEELVAEQPTTPEAPNTQE